MKNNSSRTLRRVCVCTLSIAFVAILVAIGSNFDSSAQRRDLGKSEIEPDVLMTGTITGRAFQDFNGNGNFDTTGGTAAAPVSVDIGVGGVTVTAYDSNGASQGSTVTCTALNNPTAFCTGNNNGAYSLTAGGVGPYRLEFSTIPAGYTPSARSTDSVAGGTTANSGSTEQFVQNGATSDANLALTRAEEYCQNNPNLVTPRYAQGGSDGIYTTNPVLFDFPYNAGALYTEPTEANYDTPTTHSLTVTVGQLGTINSLAYNRVTNRIYAASYYKRHAGFGPGANGTLNNTDDPGAIYVVNPTANTVVSTLTVPNATTNSHNTADYVNDNGNTGWDGTGKTSLGGMALADDNSKLFVMNLETRSLAAFTFSGSTWATSANMDGLTMNTPGGTAAQCATGGDRRPFAVRFYRGSVYIGVVCTGESTNNISNLFAYIFRVDPATLAIDPSPIYSLDLDYTRGLANGGAPAAWQPWRPTIQGTTGITAYPQAMLSDIDFDGGNLIIALRDRAGDSSLDITKRTAGDVIRACGSFGAWTTESNGRCGGTGTAPQGSGQGPGNGEFYFDDDFCTAPGNNGNFHDEVTWGAILQIPGRQDVIATLLDPIDRERVNGATFDGGVRLMNNTSGGADRAYRLYNGNGGSGDPDFGKTNGLGDIAALCAAAPIEIGNRVWNDLNRNGVQDPNEPSLAGVTVHLYLGSTLVATAVTDANGEYYFVSSTAVDPNTNDNIGQLNGQIGFNTAYQIRLDNPTNYQTGNPLSGFLPTVLNQTTQLGDDDSSDSDSALVTNPAGSPAGTFPVISITTGGPGANDHTFDFGFQAISTAAGVSVSGYVMLEDGRGVTNAKVSLTEADGTTHVVITGRRGAFNFGDIESGQTVVVRVVSRRFRFDEPTRIVSLNDNVSDIVFVASGY